MKALWNSVKRIGVAVTFLSALSSCATQTAQEQNADVASAISNALSPQTEAGPKESATNENEPEAGPVAMVSLGTGELISPRPERPPISLDGDAVMLNFEQAPLSEVVHTILGDTLGLDYVVEHPVGGEITLRTRSPVPRDQLLSILESLLRNNAAY